MMLETIFGLVVVLLAVGGVIAYYLVAKDEKKKLIQREIERVGGSMVEISGDDERDRDTFTFNVRFQNSEGRLYKTRCKVHKSSSQLYWTQNPAYLLEHTSGFTAMNLRFDSESYPFSYPEFNLDDDGSKEMVINSLTSPYRYERQVMAKQLAEFETVDEVILQLLQEIVERDEDEGVRETAVSTLKILNQTN